MGKEYPYTEDPYGGDPNKKWVGTGAQGKPVTTKPLSTMDHGDRLFDRNNRDYNEDGQRYII